MKLYECIVNCIKRDLLNGHISSVLVDKSLMLEDCVTLMLDDEAPNIESTEKLLDYLRDDISEYTYNTCKEFLSRDENLSQKEIEFNKTFIDKLSDTYKYVAPIHNSEKFDSMSADLFVSLMPRRVILKETPELTVTENTDLVKEFLNSVRDLIQYAPISYKTSLEKILNPIYPQSSCIKRVTI